MKATNNVLKTIKPLLISTALVLISNSATARESVEYPKDFRNWTHIKSMVILPGHALADQFEGIHHVYANEKALAGLKSGRYQDGSALVFDLLEYNEGQNTLSEGKRKLIGIMEKNELNFKTTGGWGFEAFDSNSRTKRLTNDGGVGCFQCHTQSEKNGFVFSSLRE